MVNNVEAIVDADGSFSAVDRRQAGRDAASTPGGRRLPAARRGHPRGRGRRAPAPRREGRERDHRGDVEARRSRRSASPAGPMIKSTDMTVDARADAADGALGRRDRRGLPVRARLRRQPEMTDAKIQLTPVDGGLSFPRRDRRPRCPRPHALRGGVRLRQHTTDVTANKVAIAGTLLVSPDGMNGFRPRSSVDQNVHAHGPQHHGLRHPGHDPRPDPARQRDPVRRLRRRRDVAWAR